MKIVGKVFFLVFCITFLLSNKIVAQNNEIGGSIGVLNYKGEVASIMNPIFSRPGISLFYRRNFSPAVSLKISAMGGFIYANEKNANNPVPKVRNAEFSNFISELGGMLEYNFLNYRDNKVPVKLAPYLTGGLALYNLNVSKNRYEENQIYTQVSIPIGFGVKYMLNEHWNLGGEFIARRATDFLDGLHENMLNNKLIADPVDKDWYYFLGFSISYTFYSIHCPDHHNFGKK